MYYAVIVDDEAWAARGLADIICWERKGYSVKAVCSDPEEAIEVIRRERPDVVFADVRMYSMTGIEMIEALKAEGVKSEFILISAYQDFTYARRGIDLGVFAYIVKPFDAGEISECVDRLTERLGKKNQNVVFPFGDKAFYSSDIAVQFLRASMTRPFYRIMIMPGAELGEAWKNAVRITVEGGIEAWLCLYESADGVRSAYAGVGAGRLHDCGCGEDMYLAVREAYYSRYCDFIYANDEIAGKIQYFLCENMGRQLSIAQIAKEFSFSDAYLCTLFKRHTKQTIVRFQHLIRVRYALHLIRTTNSRLRDIAERVGFDNYNYFGKVFKALTWGHTPEMYRKASEPPREEGSRAGGPPRTG
jgi:two-component system response regulator YesN